MTEKNGGPAFPTTKPLESWDDPNVGMSLRDYFAGQAIAGRKLGAGDRAEGVAADAYMLADAMIAERERGQ